MKKLLSPISPTTPKEEFIRQLEDLILGGKLNPGEKLPPERELAETMKVSRPVVHEGLLDLEAKGLITMKPRHGCWINDYRKSGSLELLNALYRYDRGALEPHLDEGLEELRRLILEASADRIVRMKEGGQSEYKEALSALSEEFANWEAMASSSVEDLAEGDFRFYFTLVLYSQNPIYPLILNSAKAVYLGVLKRFFEHEGYYQGVSKFKATLIEALNSGSRDRVKEAIDTMSAYSSYGMGYGE